MTRMPAFRSIALVSAAALLSGCLVGPNYVRPTVSTPTAFKEAAGWAPAAPADAAPRGDWWVVLNDPVLNDLERQVEVSNQNLAAAEAAYRQSRAMVSEQRAALFPTVDLTGSATRSSSHSAIVVPPTGGTGTGTGATVAGAHNQYQLGVGASWEPDLWGRIRRTVEGAGAQAEASAADLANARLSAQSQLAVDYVQMRADDGLIALLDLTAEGYQRSLTIAQNRYNAGIAAKNDVLTAQTQLANAQAQAVDLGQQRAQLEHAIAVLTGQPPANLTLQPTAWSLAVPVEPVGVPSTILQRRPDIASSERLVANANAQIGVQTAAYFPSLTLSGQYGVSSSSLGNLFSASSTLWSLGANVTETVLDFGARKARVAEARAAYDQTVAQYRQTVLTAFQEVEDALAAQRVLSQEAPLRQQASQAADQAETIALNQYKAGIADYTTVVVAQVAAQNARQSYLTLQSNRIVAALDLVKALGGGWAPTGPGGLTDPVPPPPPAPAG